MSFSPQIDSSFYAVGNMFSTTGVTDGYFAKTNPLPNHETLSTNNAGTPVEFVYDPVNLPTLKSFRDGTKWPRAFRENPDIDYLVYCVKATLAYSPKILSDKSNFLDWQQGFGFGFFTEVWGYKNGAPGASDTFITSYLEGDTSDSWMGVDSSYNTTNAANYYATNFETTAYDVFFYDIRFAMAVTETPDSSEYETGGETQVLLSTRFGALYGENSSFKLDGSWIYPNGTLTTIARNRTYYPYANTPISITDAPGVDLTLFQQTLSHNYDSGYDYVRQDIKERFKTTNIIENQRNDYINNIVENAKSTLSVTSNSPKGYTLRKQVSPKIMRQNYTTFTNNANMTINTATNTTTMTMGGGGSY